ncbi:MAG: AAA family ATPase [Bacteroidota bacterium]
MKVLPIGIQRFKDLRENDNLYVNKNRITCDLPNSGKYYFLSRPRRFGKSLLLSTIKELFLRSRELFNDLWIADHWDWGQKHNIIHISFSSIGYKTMRLEAAVHNALDQIAKEYKIELTATAYDQKFKELIQALATDTKTVILIDEYDKPIIDYLTDLPQAQKHQEILKNFYSVIKDSDQCIRFLRITESLNLAKSASFQN